jgi:hypothetical protein
LWLRIRDVCALLGLGFVKSENMSMPRRLVALDVDRAGGFEDLHLLFI